MDTQPLGRIVFLDGPDGVGKTTQTRELASFLEARGQTVYITRVNGGTEIGEALRNVFLSHAPRPVITDVYIAMALNAALAEKVNAKKAEGVFVLIDRSPASIIAYQGYGGGYAVERAVDAAKTAFALYNYDMVLCYEAPINVLFEHQQSRPVAENSDYFASKPDDYLENVIRGYHFAAQTFNFPVIDATGTVEEVRDRTLQQLQSILPES